MFRILSAATLVITLSCYALPSDRFQKVYISANKSSYNYKTGTNIYEGNVKVKQGSTHLSADKLITKTNKRHRIYEATAYGFKNKAHYWTTTKPNEPTMHGWAKKMKYYPLQGNISLYKQAKIIQKQNSFHGDLIHYNSIDQVITVPGKTNNRSVLVYNPDN